MTASVVQSKDNSASGSAALTLSFTSALTTGNLIVVAVLARSVIISVADTDLRTYTQQRSFQVTQGGQPYAAIYTAPVGTGTSPTITLTQTGTDWETIVAHELTGADVTSAPFSTSGVATINNTTTPSVVTDGSSGANELGLGWLIIDGGNQNVAPGTGWTELTDRTSSLGAQSQSKGVDSATLTSDWTMSQDVAAAMVAVIISGGGGGGASIVPILDSYARRRTG